MSGGAQLGLDGMPERARRVVLTQGARAWWGVDSSSRSVAIGARVDHEGDGSAATVREAVFPSGAVSPARLGEIVELTARLATDVAMCWAPGFVAFEKPAAPRRRGGKDQGPNFPMIYALGAVQAGLALGIRRAMVPLPVFDTEVIASAWKKLVCGRGDLWKPKPAEVRQGATYGVHDWALASGLVNGSSSWDCADAAAIARYAELTVELRVR